MLFDTENQNNNAEIHENIKSMAEEIENEEEKDYEELYNKALKDIEHNKKLAMADKENLRKDFENQKRELLKYAAGSIVEDLIPVLDSFDMALQYYPDEQKAGILMIKKEFLKTLSKNGVKEIEPKSGDKFDPKIHEAMSSEASEEYENDQIIKTIQNGYSVSDRTVKAARVIVTKND